MLLQLVRLVVLLLLMVVVVVALLTGVANGTAYEGELERFIRK